MMRCGVSLVLGLILSMSVATADELAEKGRKIFADNKAAVVTVQLVLKQKFSMAGRGSQDNETKSDAMGTVIDPSGLTVLSLSETDPTALLELTMGGSPQLQGMQMETEVQDVKILLEDGTEVQAEIVLRDKVLDMAFVRPTKKPDKAFAYIDMSSPGEPQILDQVISLSRLGKVARRAYAASVERIDAIVTKPRTLYIPGNDPTNTNLGSPAFMLDGRPIGVFLLRAIKDTGGGGGGMFGGSSGNIMTVLLPAADILEAASQAPPFEDN